jgi:hypothetical protein
MKPPPGVPWDAGGGAKAEALTLSHLETDFRDAQVIDFAGGIFRPVSYPLRDALRLTNLPDDRQRLLRLRTQRAARQGRPAADRPRHPVASLSEVGAAQAALAGRRAAAQGAILTQIRVVHRGRR